MRWPTKLMFCNILDNADDMRLMISKVHMNYFENTTEGYFNPEHYGFMSLDI